VDWHASTLLEPLGALVCEKRKATGEPAMTPKLTSKLQCKSISRWLGPARMLAATACAVLLFSALAPFAIAQTPTLIVVRALPAKLKKGETAQALPPLTKTDVGEIKLGGKTVEMTDFQPVLKGPHVLQLMVILDSEEMLGAAGQFDEIKKFFADMPPNVEIGVGWLLQGNVKVVQPFTTDRDLAGKALIAKAREEAANPKNDNGNPYQCLRNLAAHWPDGDPGKLRAVLMFTDGITRGNGQAQANDQLNPDVAGASQLLERAGIVPYPFFWMDPIVADPNRAPGGQLEGQTNFSQLVADTGGAALYEGIFAPGSLTPLLNRLYSTLESEAILTVNAPAAPGKQLRLDLKANRDDIKIFGPDQVTVGNVLPKK
jgi:hypothetical protein